MVKQKTHALSHRAGAVNEKRAAVDLHQSGFFRDNPE
jgi:hypothetical protein